MIQVLSENCLFIDHGKPYTFNYEYGKLEPK